MENKVKNPSETVAVCDNIQRFILLGVADEADFKSHHNNSVNVLWLDGHVSNMKTKEFSLERDSLDDYYMNFDK